MQLRDTAALVTGGGRGIGRAIALALAERGARIAIADVRGPHAERVAEEIRAGGARALAVEADVTAAEQVRGLVERVVSAFGGIDVLVNNAGIVSFGKLVDLSEEQW